MKIGIAQINPTIGDFAGNAGKVLSFAERARAAGCALAPAVKMNKANTTPVE